MRIGVNALYLLPGVVGGTETYLRNLLRHLAVIDQTNEYILFTNRECHGTFGTLPANFRDVLCTIRATSRPKRIFWEQLILPLQLKQHKIDLLFSPGFTAPWALPCRSVVTIHDMIWWHYPENFSRPARLALRLLIPSAAKKADRIIAPSKSTKDEVIRRLGIDRNRISVVYEAPSEGAMKVSNESLIEELLGRLGITRDFILCVSHLAPHKNLQRLIQGFELLWEQYGRREKLVLVGIPWRSAGETMGIIERRALQGKIVVTGWVEQKDLWTLYSAARLFVYPSLMEGFGLPVLEAMACGAPVAASNTSSIPEVAGDAALLFDPLNVEAMAGAMGRVLNDPNLQAAMVKKGYQRIKDFSWETAAWETLEVFVRTRFLRKVSKA